MMGGPGPGLVGDCMNCMQGVGSATKELGDESLVASGLRSVGRGFTTLERQLDSASGKGQGQVGLRLAFLWTASRAGQCCRTGRCCMFQFHVHRRCGKPEKRECTPSFLPSLVRSS